MKHLILFRHAKSSWDDPQLLDFERPLNARGHRDAPRMALRLGEWLRQMPAPVRWASSPARRAWDTARYVAEQLELTGNRLTPIPELYHAEPDTLLKVVRSQPDAAATVILFGHNPGLTAFATQLCNRDFVNIPTAGIVGIRFATAHWAEVTHGAGEELFFEYPKKSV